MESLNSKKDALENKLNEADVATVRLEKKLEDSKNKNQSMVGCRIFVIYCRNARAPKFLPCVPESLLLH